MLNFQECLGFWCNFVRDKHLTAYTRNTPEVNVAQWLIQMHHAASTEVNDNLLRCQSKVKPKANEEVYVSVVKPWRFLGTTE